MFLFVGFDPLPSYVTYDGEIIKHKYYTISYSEKHEQANWVAYTLTPEMLNKVVDRISYFKRDPLIETKSVSTSEYKNSGYDRGHLVPAADMSFSDEAMRETFLTSNISPQLPQFNRGIWKILENRIRKWVIDDKELHIVCGGILEEDLSTIGKNEKISVPKYFYKVILDIKEPEIKAIGFIFPNLKSDLDIMNFAVSIDFVEAFTDIDFYPTLSDDLEEILESKIDPSLW